MPNPIPISPEAFGALIGKVDDIANLVGKLVLIEERQTRQNERLAALEVRAKVTDEATLRIDRRIDKWVNLMLGGWTVVIAAFEAYRVFGKA